MGKGTQQQGKPYPPLRIPHQRAHGPCRGTLSTSLWKDKNGDSQIQLSITADALEFINTGKREGTTSEADGQAAAADNAPVPPADMPQDGEEDLPF